MDKDEIDAISKNIDLWMIRPCDIYNDEYNQCTSILSRLHQMFIHGSTIDCKHWHADYLNCLRWKNEKDVQAAENLVKSEKLKRINRLKTFYANDVWENRESPPEDWNQPLPDYIAQRKANSTLKDELNKIDEEANSKSFCLIM